jgi:hypothetical protein
MLRSRNEDMQCSTNKTRAYVGTAAKGANDENESRYLVEALLAQNAYAHREADHDIPVYSCEEREE